MIDDLDLIRIKRGTKKICRCCEPNMIVDPDARTVYCGECGAEVEAFEAIKRLAYNGERWLDRRKSLIAEVAELEKKRRRTTLFRDMERSYLTPNGGKKLYPICPCCKNTFRYEEIAGWSIRLPPENEGAP